MSYQRTKDGKFSGKRTPEIILSIVESLKSGQPERETLVKLVSKHDISFNSAWLWISIAKRVSESLNLGMSLENAIQLDKETRLEQKRAKTAH